MARLIGADANEIGWTQNTAMGISLVARGLDWREGDNVVTVQGEFPANVRPWLSLAERGVGTRLVPQRDNRVLTDDIAAAIDGRTRVLSISFVEFGTGFRNDMYALGQLCHERGVIYHVDGIQGLGALSLNAHDAGIHFMSAGAHKWLMGPQGVGIFYARQDMFDRIEPWTVNWYSAANPGDYHNYGQPLKEGAKRIEGSTRNAAGIIAFDAVLDMIGEVGPSRIEARILDLTDRLVDGLLNKGYDVISSRGPHEKSGIVCFGARGDPMDVLARAEAEKITIAVRMGVVRASPHFYNTEQDIDRLLDILYRRR
jgi:selenocysteine lyase/cysteine desulfurase